MAVQYCVPASVSSCAAKRCTVWGYRPRAPGYHGITGPRAREETETAAVVTRVAPSFVRFGHFEHFAAQALLPQLQALADHVIDRHYPQCRTTPEWGGNPCAALLHAVSERTASLMAQWQAVWALSRGDEHRQHILGLTIDYGPFQFFDAFAPGHVCNHSDTQGRYAYNRQPHVAYWNLLCLAQALLPLIGDQDTARSALASYKTVFRRIHGPDARQAGPGRSARP